MVQICWWCDQGFYFSREDAWLGRWIWRILMKNCVEGSPECAMIGGWFSYKIGQIWGFGFGNEGSALGSEFNAVNRQRETSSDAIIAQVDWVLALGLENFEINPWHVGSNDNCFGFYWGMDVENGSGKLILGVGCIGNWLYVERGSEDVAFEVFNINENDVW